MQRDPRAISVLSGYVNASGTGATSIQDFSASGTITYFWGNKQVQAPATAEGLGAADFRLDAQLPEGTRSWVVTRTGGTLKSPDGRSSRIPWANAVHLISATWPLPSILAAMNSPSTSITFVGHATIGKRSAYDIRIEQVLPAEVDPHGRLSKMTVQDIFIDTTSYLALGVQDTTHSANSRRDTYSHRVLFSNYQTVNGISVPFSVTEEISGQRTWSFQLGSISFNTGLAAASFNL